MHTLASFSRANTVGTVTDSSGIIRSATNRPRFDCDPVTGICKGLLIEEQRTNLLTYSQEFDSVAWTKTRLNVTGTPAWVNQIVAPDGTTTAEKLIEDTTVTNNHIAFQTISSTATSICFSAFIKVAERSKVFIQAYTNSSTSGIQCTFDLLAVTAQASALGTGSSIASGINDYGNGWYRCWMSCTATAGTTITQTTMLMNGAATSYTGDGTSGIYIWGAQLEAGSFPTSYIPTTTAAVTRSADVCTVALSNLVGPHGEPLWNGTEGTLLVRGTNAVLPPAGSYLCPASLDDGTGNNCVRARLLSDGFDANVIVGGVAQADTVQTPYTAGAQYSLAVAFRNADIVAAKDGSVFSAQFTGSIPAVTKLSIGSLAGVANYLNGHIRQVLLFNRRLSNSDLQALTAA
jgi:hypothetical protein